MIIIHKTDSEKQIEVDILEDDSIEMAKYKLSIRLKCNINDIYLFAKQKKMLTTRKVYEEMLTKATELERGDMETFFYNVNRPVPDLPDKVYTYDDLLSLIDITEMEVNIPVGHVVRVCANPFDCKKELEFDYTNYLVTYKKLNTLNPTLILDYMPFIDNTLYVVCKKDVPVQKPYFMDVDTPVATLKKKAEIMNLYENKLQAKASIIQNLEFTILAPKVSIPLESIFNLLHASELYPMIQYNTGSTLLYKLHTVNKDIKNNKIPVLSKSAIVNQDEIQNLYKIKSVNVYIESRKKIVMFKEDGSIQVYLYSLQVNEKDIDEFIHSILNPILEIVKEPLRQSGHAYQWRSIWANSAEIKVNALTYIIDFNQNVYNDANFNNISNLCIRIKGEQCIYLRVSNFDKNKLSYQIMTHLILLNTSSSSIIKTLTSIFDMSDEAATELLTDFMNKDEKLKMEGKIQLKIKSGFEVIVKPTRIVIDSIDNMHYLASIKRNVEAMAYVLVNTKKDEVTYIPEQFEEPEFIPEFEQDLEPEASQDDYFKGFMGGGHGIDAHKLKNDNFAITRFKTTDTKKHVDYSSKCLYDKVPIVLTQKEWESEKYDVYRKHVEENPLLKKEINGRIFICPKYWSFKKTKAYLSENDLEEGKIIDIEAINERNKTQKTKISEIVIDEHGEYLPYPNYFNKKQDMYKYPDFVKGKDKKRDETMPCCFIIPQDTKSQYHKKKEQINLVNEDYISREDRPINNMSNSLKYGYLSEPLRIFFKVDEKCNFIKDESLSLLRLGPSGASNFLYTMFTIHLLPLPDTHTFTYDKYLDSLLDGFETAQNGNLAVKYKTREECRKHMNTMTHEDAWDLVSHNANIVIFKNSTVTTFELICPSNVYRSPKFNKGSVTYMLYMHSDYSYEIIVKKDKLKTDRAFHYADEITKDALQFIENKYNNECKPTIQYKVNGHTPTQNITAEEMYDKLADHVDEQESIGQVVQKNKCIGFVINGVFIPCYPSSKLDIEEVEIPEPTIQEAFKFLTKLSKIVPCKPLYKVIGLNQDVTGLLTETNQYVPCTKSHSKLKLEPYYANLQYEYDINPVEDNTRTSTTNRIKYEQYGYKYCLNLLMIKLNTHEYFEFRKKIKDSIQSKKTHTEKMVEVSKVIKEVLRGEIEWIDKITDVYINYMVDNCPNGFCTNIKPMLLSSVNLVTKLQNQYYVRLADELIRNKKITSFVLKPQLQFYVPYEARDNELILDKFGIIKYMDELGPVNKIQRFYDNALVKQTFQKYTTFKVEKQEFIRI
jgi:hypothetical protein